MKMLSHLSLTRTLSRFTPLLLLAFGVSSGSAAMLIVTNANDNGPGTLRERVAVANPGDQTNYPQRFYSVQGP